MAPLRPNHSVDRRIRHVRTHTRDSSNLKSTRSAPETSGRQRKRTGSTKHLRHTTFGSATVQNRGKTTFHARPHSPRNSYLYIFSTNGRRKLGLRLPGLEAESVVKYRISIDADDLVPDQLVFFDGLSLQIQFPQAFEAEKTRGCDPSRGPDVYEPAEEIKAFLRGQRMLLELPDAAAKSLHLFKKALWPNMGLPRESR